MKRILNIFIPLYSNTKILKIQEDIGQNGFEKFKIYVNKKAIPYVK